MTEYLGWTMTTGDRANPYSAADWRWSVSGTAPREEAMASRARKQTIARRRARLIAERNRWKGRPTDGR